MRAAAEGAILRVDAKALGRKSFRSTNIFAGAKTFREANQGGDPVRSPISKALLVGTLAMLAGCATTTEYVAPLPVEATLTNYTGKTIARIDYQSCGDSAGTWSQLGVGPVASGGTATFQLPAPCVNMNAFYEDGRLAGTQTGVKREFPFKWTLS